MFCYLVIVAKLSLITFNLAPIKEEISDLRRILSVEIEDTEEDSTAEKQDRAHEH